MMMTCQMMNSYCGQWPSTCYKKVCIVQVLFQGHIALHVCMSAFLFYPITMNYYSTSSHVHVMRGALCNERFRVNLHISGPNGKFHAGWSSWPKP